MNLNLKAKQENTYDAIVVGSGISGGWAAKELAEKGLKTLVLERGRDVKHPEDYHNAMKNVWEFSGRGKLTPEQRETTKKKQLRAGGFINSATADWFVNDEENPYNESKRFDWIRGYHVGGRSIMWGRQSYRWSEMDFEANAKDGIGVDWPIRYKELAPWYDYVESFAGISGQNEGLAQLPDGKFLPPMEMNCIEKHVKKKIAENFNGRVMTIGRTANLTQPHNGRGKCMFRNRCIYGCPYGAYFSSNVATLPTAAASGNMTLRPFSIVNSIIYDKDTKKAKGVRVIDANTNETIEFYAKIVFLNASAMGSLFILMNTKTEATPSGLGNENDLLGRYVMDHHFRAGAYGKAEGFEDKYYSGRRANGIYIPRFRNIDEKHPDFIRGYGYQGGGRVQGWKKNLKTMGIGADLKAEAAKPGEWSFVMTGFGECLPYYDNRVTLNKDKIDKWNQPTLQFDVEFRENEQKMREDMQVAGAEMLEAAGLKNVGTTNKPSFPGNAIHEMGGAPMGKDPKKSVLNKWNQLHECKNVFVTDGACMSSSACQNPSLTYMALTARAADHAINELKKQNL